MQATAPLKKAEISAAEWQIMRIVWTLTKVTSKKIIEIMKRQEPWSDSTIKTLITRLMQKGFLKREKIAGMFEYSATVSERTAMQTSASQLFNNFCAHKVGSVLVDLIATLPLSRSDIEQLQETLTLKMATAPKQVPCNCLTGGCGDE